MWSVYRSDSWPYPYQPDTVLCYCDVVKLDLPKVVAIQDLGEDIRQRGNVSHLGDGVHLALGTFLIILGHESPLSSRRDSTYQFHNFTSFYRQKTWWHLS